MNAPRLPELRWIKSKLPARFDGFTQWLNASYPRFHQLTRKFFLLSLLQPVSINVHLRLKNLSFPHSSPTWRLGVLAVKPSRSTSPLSLPPYLKPLTSNSINLLKRFDVTYLTPEEEAKLSSERSAAYHITKHAERMA